jgi:hypothetical protein
MNLVTYSNSYEMVMGYCNKRDKWPREMLGPGEMAEITKRKSSIFLLLLTSLNRCIIDWIISSDSRHVTLLQRNVVPSSIEAILRGKRD